MKKLISKYLANFVIGKLKKKFSAFQFPIILIAFSASNSKLKQDQSYSTYSS